jgi:hypothetical protein
MISVTLLELENSLQGRGMENVDLMAMPLMVDQTYEEPAPWIRNHRPDQPSERR